MAQESREHDERKAEEADSLRNEDHLSALPVAAHQPAPEEARHLAAPSFNGGGRQFTRECG